PRETRQIYGAGKYLGPMTASPKRKASGKSPPDRGRRTAGRWSTRACRNLANSERCDFKPFAAHRFHGIAPDLANEHRCSVPRTVHRSPLEPCSAAKGFLCPPLSLTSSKD